MNTVRLSRINRCDRTNRILTFSSSIAIVAIICLIRVSIAQDLTPNNNNNLEGTSAQVDADTRQTDQTLNSFTVSQALELVRDWAQRFGRDIHYGTQEATCLRSIRDQYDPAIGDAARRGDYRASIVSNDWTQMHKDIVKTISNFMSWHQKAVESVARESEELASSHVYDKNLRFDYVDVHRLQNIDDQDTFSPNELDVDEPNSSYEPNYSNSSQSTHEASNINTGDAGSSPDDEGGPDSTPIQPLPKPMSLQAAPVTTQAPQSASSSSSQGEWQTPIRYLKLGKHKNFGDVLINTEESAVHVPVHIYPGEEQVMNGIAWSEQLTKVFRDNFVRNPKLTNQYFASQQGFMRLYPAQPWQIARTDPDLYDARMRPWYVAGASSRKDMVILVDSSGSMTGSRRDIAKGVVFEILDTLTENDHFVILKFSDTIQQVGVPACSQMRVEHKSSGVPLKNTLFYQKADATGRNETDIDSLYLLPATGKNVRNVKSNFTIPTSGIANFSQALITAFEVLRNYQDSNNLGSQCNQAIMLVTDGSPSDFEEVFNRYNYPNAPVRVFTYLIGREAGDVTHTKLMACHNRGFYTHVINLAEVRETVQQYIPVMARPLVLNGTHPITWTPAYGDLTYQILTDWIWESRRRDKARALLASSGRSSSGSNSNGGNLDIKVTNDDSHTMFTSEDGENLESSSDESIESIDLFGYEANPECFWQTRRNNLTTTVVQPVYDRRNETIVTEKFLSKNVWTVKETPMRNAQILGIAAADMSINDIVMLAPSHKLGPNGYAVMLTNNGLAMHHPDMRSVVEPLSSDIFEKNMRILKPYFTSLDFTQVEHVLNSELSEMNLLALRKEAVSGLTGWRELMTKRALDCNKRVQSRRQSFYYKPIEQSPFSFMIAIPQPYGSHRIEAQMKLKDLKLREKLTTYFTTSDYDIWTVHPEYQYCDGPANHTIATLIDVFHRIEAQKFDEIQWRAAESAKPPLPLPGKVVCDQDLIQSLVYDAVATFGFSDTCGPPSLGSESNMLEMYGVRFSFVATRSGLTRVRRFNLDDKSIRREAFAFALKHARAVDETFYSRTVDYNMLLNDSSTLFQVPFNQYEKIRERLTKYETSQFLSSEDIATNSSGNPDFISSEFAPASPELIRTNVRDMNLFEKLQILTNSSLHMIATRSIVASEGAQQAVAGVTGVFYDYATFVMRFFNTTNSKFDEGKPVIKPAVCFGDNPPKDVCDESKTIHCGLGNDTIDCLLIDNNGYIVVSEDLNYIGKHLRSYDPHLMSKLVNLNVFFPVNLTDHQAICLRRIEKQVASDASPQLSSILTTRRGLIQAIGSFLTNFVSILTYSLSLLALLPSSVHGSFQSTNSGYKSKNLRQSNQPSISAMFPDKTYLQPCRKVTTLYETRPGSSSGSDSIERFTSACGCGLWFVYERVPLTNLYLLVIDMPPKCRQQCSPPKLYPDVSRGPSATDAASDTWYSSAQTEEEVCDTLERESHLYRKRLDSCFSHHPDEEHIKLCGAASKSTQVQLTLFFALISISFWFLHIDRNVQS